MTDQELIESLQQKSAGELSSAEVQAIRARWTQSPELRQALLEHLHLESQLTGALGPVQLDVDMILQRATEQQRRERANLPRWSWLIGLCLVAVVAAGTVFLLLRPPAPDLIVDGESPSVSPAEDPKVIETPAVVSEEPSAATAVVSSTQEPMVEPVSTPTSPEPLKPEAIVVAENEPWTSALSRDAVPLTADSPKLQSPYQSAGHDELSEVDAKRWLTAVEGEPSQWTTELIGNPVRRVARFQGISKLRAPWLPDAILRLTPFDVSDMTLYFWRGPTGIALRFYTRREPHLWVAFEISRENSLPRPTRLGLLCTDSGAYSRSTPGTLEIRHQGSDLVLARGGIVLLSVPCAGPPIDVFVEGQFRLRGLSMHRCEPFSVPPENPHPVVVSGAAASMPWAISAERPASFVSNRDGSVSMTSRPGEKEGLIAFPFGGELALTQTVGGTGLYEVIVNVESAEPGTGIFLGDRNGGPLQRLGFFQDTATKQLTFGILRPGEQRIESNYQPNDFPVPYVPKSSWFKLVAGLGTLHILTSGDGRHWGHVVESPGRDLPGAVGSIGLFALPGSNARTIQVNQIEIRELSGLTQMADLQRIRQVSPFQPQDWRDNASWMHRVLDTQPPDIDGTDWLSTNAVVALAQGPPKEIGLSLLRQLVAVGLQSTRSFEKKRLLVDDAVSLCDLFDEGSAKTVASWYEELGWQLANGGDLHPLKTVRPAWLRSPLWSDTRFRNVWERLQSFEILQAVYRRDWANAWSHSQSSLFWNLLPHPDQRPTDRGEEVDRHAKWAKALVAENAPQLDDGTAGVMPIALRHPLVPVLSKEAYNIRAELQSALTGQTYDDACRVVMSIAEHDGPGLLPDLEDRQLYVSMSTAIATARRNHPGFVKTMAEKFEPLGQLRVRSAMNRKDVAALKAATVQFMGTDAARAAHLSLGELALSVGQFETAEQHFHEGLVDASLRWQEILTTRLLLAQASDGRLPPERNVGVLTESIDFNGTVISKAEFQNLLSDLAERPTARGVLQTMPPTPHLPFATAFYRLEPRAQFDGQPGNNPGRHEFRFGDVFGKQFSVTADAQQMFISNRFQVNAYHVSDGRQLWAQGLGSEQGETYALASHPMKPLLTSEHLIVRRLTKAGIELACLKRDDGQIVWQQRPSLSVLTDPVIWNGRLFAITLARLEEDLLQVEATWIDASSGKINSSRPLFRLRESTDRPFGGQLAISDRLAVCTVGGTVACFDSRGEIRWLKRLMLMQKPVDELAEDVRVAPPVIQSDRVVVAIPGVREVQCLDLDSGSSIWELPVVNLRGLISATESRAVLDTTTHVLAIDTGTGAIVWRYPCEDRLEACHVEDGTLLLSRRVTFANRRARPVLTWLDLRTGQERGQSLVEISEREEFQLGPMWSAGGKWWSLVGQSWKDPKRELDEFVALSATAPRPFTDETLQAWRPELSETQLAEIQAVLPGWFPVANYRDRLIIHAGDLRGETSVLVSKIDPQNSIRLISRVHLTPGRKHTLRLRLGNQPGQTWGLSVRVANQILSDQRIEDPGSGNPGWRDLTFDLSPWAGQDIPVQVIQSTTSNSAVEALWKSAVLLTE